MFTQFPDSTVIRAAMLVVLERTAETHLG